MNVPIRTRMAFASAALMSKLYLNIFNKQVVVRNRETFLKAVNRPAGRPLITISNHTSGVDDPILWTALFGNNHLLRTVFSNQSSVKRWTLGAEEICFKNNLMSAYCTAGRIIPVRRGLGIHQPAMERALRIIRAGDWLHIFVEGKISNTPDTLLTPIRWGIGRLVMECCPPPWILPIVHLGMERVVTQGNWWPRRTRCIDIRVGPIVDGGLLQQSLPSGNVNVLRSAVTKYLEECLVDLYELDNPVIDIYKHKHINT